MKNAIIVSTLVILLLAGCQSTPKQSSTEEATPVTESTEMITSPEAASVIPTAAGFYSGEAAAGKTPQFHLWIEPSVEEVIPPAQIECNGQKAVVYSSPNGLELDNHCIINTGNFQANIVLPDLSMVFLDKNSVVQFNFDDAGTEIVLQQGTLYTSVAEQNEGDHFLVTVANSQIEAVGTEFGVAVKDGVTTVIMTAGKVTAYLCEQWQGDICTAWDQTREYLIPFASYSHNVSDEEWSKTEIEYNEMIGDPSPSDLLMNSREYDGTFWQNAAFMNSLFDSSREDLLSEYPAENERSKAYEYLWKYMKKSIGNLSQSWAYSNYTDDELMNMANEKNEAMANFYCEENPKFCFAPTARPTLVLQLPVETSAPASGSSSSGSSSGSSAGACANVPADLLAQVHECDCSNKSVYGVFCYADYGEGWYPEACARSLNLCR
jgi:hypothetical protein